MLSPQHFYNSVIVAIYVGDIENHWLLMANVGCDVNRSIAWITRTSHYYRYAFFLLHFRSYINLFIRNAIDSYSSHNQQRYFSTILVFLHPLSLLYAQRWFTHQSTLPMQRKTSFLSSISTLSFHSHQFLCTFAWIGYNFFVSYFPWKCKICKYA